jgi:hypothetical protein
MSKILSIDPGPKLSAYVVFCKIIGITRPIITKSGYISNDNLLSVINEIEFDYLAVEGVSSFGKKVGNSTFKTCEWSGRFLQRGLDMGKKGIMLYRSKAGKVKSIRSAMCGKHGATSAEVNKEVRQRLPNSVGTKNKPGPLYLEKKDHLLSAAAVGLTFIDSDYYRQEIML